MRLEARKRRTFSAGPRTVLRSEPSRRECVALARLARQPVPHAVSLAGRPRKQRGQSCISRDARRAPRRRTVAGSGAQRVHRSRVTGRTAPVWAAALGTAELDSRPARTDPEASVVADFADPDARRQHHGQQACQGQPQGGSAEASGANACLELPCYGPAVRKDPADAR